MLLPALLSPPPAIYQEIPAHVRYKRASKKENDEAKAILERMFKEKPEVAAAHFASATVCASGLWSKIAAAAPAILKNATTTRSINPDTPNAPPAMGRAFKTSAQRLALARVLISTYGKQKLQVRRPTSNEISAYWAIIAWDIEEPLFVADVGKDHLLLNFIKQGGKQKILYVDKI